MNKALRPNSLRNHSHVTVVRGRDDDMLTMFCEDGQSFELGSYWDAETNAIPYLLNATGERDFAEGLVTTAWNFGTALGDIQLNTVVSVDMSDPDETHREILRRMFGDSYSEMFDERPDEEATHIDPITVRGE